jgi:hypothetical protein
VRVTQWARLPHVLPDCTCWTGLQPSATCGNVDLLRYSVCKIFEPAGQIMQGCCPWLSSQSLGMSVLLISSQISVVYCGWLPLQVAYNLVYSLGQHTYDTDCNLFLRVSQAAMNMCSFSSLLVGATAAGQMELVSLGWLHGTSLRGLCSVVHEVGLSPGALKAHASTHARCKQQSGHTCQAVWC